MRYNAPFLVMRRSRPIGRPNGPMRVTVEYQAYSVADALKWAAYEQQRSQNPPEFRAWMRGSQRWIERRGQSARKSPQRRPAPVVECPQCDGDGFDAQYQSSCSRCHGRGKVVAA